MYTEYVDLPAVPENLIESADNTLARDLRSKRGSYETRHVSPELLEYLRSIFNADIIAQYQFFDINVPIHADTTRVRVYNYILDTGGDNVSTGFYENGQLVYSVVFQPRKWHYVDTLISHGIHGIHPNRRRMSIGVQAVRINDEMSQIISGIRALPSSDSLN